MCQILLHEGADPNQEDNTKRYVITLLLSNKIQVPSLMVDRNAIDMAWIVILSNRGDASTRQGLRALFPGDKHIEEQNFTLLHRTVLGLNPLDLETLLASSPRLTVDERDASGRTALWWAAFRADCAAMVSLLKHGANANQKCSLGYSPLHEAIFSCNQACIRLLLEKSAHLDSNPEGYSPLLQCSYFGSDLAILGILLARGADIDSVSPCEETALMLATQEKQHKICEYLISQGAGLNRVNIDGESALHYAVYNKNHRGLRLLLQSGAIPSVKTKAGETLLHHAAQFGDVECLEILDSFNLKGTNSKDKVSGISPIRQFKVKGLSALEIAIKRPKMPPEWLTTFRRLIHHIEFPESKVSTTTISSEAEEFQDALEHQNSYGKNFLVVF